MVIESTKNEVIASNVRFNMGNKDQRPIEYRSETISKSPRSDETTTARAENNAVEP
jgi:hypothetical protein